MTPWLWILGAGLLGAAAVLWRIRAVQRRQRAAVRQVRQSELYAHIYPLLQRCPEERIEQVTLTREGLFIRLFEPPGRLLTYRFARHGFSAVEEAALYPLAQALGVDQKALADPRRFAFHARERIHPNGQREAYYQYQITNAYKSALQRGRYVRGGRAG